MLNVDFSIKIVQSVISKNRSIVLILAGICLAFDFISVLMTVKYLKVLLHCYSVVFFVI